MAKCIARLYCVVEVVIEADNIEEVPEMCDLNITDMSTLPCIITEIDDVIEVEPYHDK